MGIAMDERICSGGYFAMAFRYFKKFMKDPKLLELPPDQETVYETKYRKRDFFGQEIKE